MRGSRAARIATLSSLLAAAAAVTYLAFFLFGPSYTTCSISTAVGATPAPMVCRSAGWLEMQFAQPMPRGAAVDLRPVAFLSAWALAPFVALVGTRLRSRGVGVALVALGFVVDASSFISMGGGFVFALLCGPLLLIALAAMLVALARSRMG